MIKKSASQRRTFFVLLSESVTDFPIDLQQPLFIQFDDRPIVSHQAVQLSLAVSGLCVNSSRKALESHLVQLLGVFHLGVGHLFLSVKLHIAPALVFHPSMVFHLTPNTTVFT